MADMTWWYLVLSGVLFILGTFGVLVRRNLISLLLSIEIMLNAANLVFVTFSRLHGNVTGQAVSLFVIAVAASEVAIGLAIAVLVFRIKNSIGTDPLNLLKG